MMEFLERTTRNLLLTGKGGVGKTSLACALAVRLADAGRRVLLVSTDPASNLDEVLGFDLAHHPTPVRDVVNLWAMNLDPEQAAAEYRERIVGPYRHLLPEAAVASMEEQFSGSCTLEVAAFDEFSRLLGDPQATRQFSHVIFDTAPTGHTLRLLSLPSAWSSFMETNTTGTSCLGPLAGLQAQQELYQQTLRALSDPGRTTLILVTRPEHTALQEAARTSRELAALGIQNQRLVVNGLLQTSDAADAVAVAMRQRAKAALREMPEEIGGLPRSVIPLLPNGLVGIPALRQLGASSQVAAVTTPTVRTTAEELQLPPSLEQLVSELATSDRGVILTMGKGGVGKTTIAAAIAVALAERGIQVHLSTTDPAAHLATTIASDTLSNLTVSRIDPAAETARYSDEVMRTAGADLDDQGRALLAEDLRSPCTEEIAVFRAFAEAVAEGDDRIVVLDTAPTGHTILLLDAALAYHREVTRQSTGMPVSVQMLLPRLRDRQFTRVLVVTLAEATPVHEAAALQRDLRRAGIEPYAWVINQSLAPLDISEPVLQARRSQEWPYIAEVTDDLAGRVALIPWHPEPPVGPKELRKLLRPRHSGHLR